MGSYLTRTRAWVYIAFYDEYVGRHVNTSAGLSVLFFIPLYLYGLKLNRIVEQNANHYLYNWQYFDKRNRLTHNLIMEHFEVHKESLEDLIVQLNRQGPRVFADIPKQSNWKQRPITTNDLALLDELSGLTTYLENFMLQHDIPEATKAHIRAHMHTYNSPKPKAVALQEIKEVIYGGQR